MTDNLNFLTHIRDESARFIDVLRDAPPDAQVPTCPDWRTDDLLWHLGEVQWFWATIVREAVMDPATLDDPERPADRAGLLEFLGSSSAALVTALAETEPEAARWTWAPEQTAGFILRRQAHEALIHRLDAELTAGVERSTMDPALCTDGVDETLRVMFAGVPEWGHTEPEPAATLRLHAEDTGDSWLVTMGRFTGTDPDGTSHDEPDIMVAESDSGAQAAATVVGAAADLDCWLWSRPTMGPLERSGDQEIHTRFQAFIGQGID
ncbi:MAG TPA: maleylpyruvate isomerase family mycothiol-dependent enzyme [Nocardioidaceae bacterium]|nr:maleylpyruvate isomerase family mycothiol-dependent enzyme [Nocardioidaceae bacterium]